MLDTPVADNPQREPETAIRSLTAPFAQAQDRRAWAQLLTTAALFVVGWGLMALGVRLGWSYGYVLLLALPVSGFYVRLFIFQHFMYQPEAMCFSGIKWLSSQKVAPAGFLANSSHYIR